MESKIYTQGVFSNDAGIDLESVSYRDDSGDFLIAEFGIHRESLPRTVVFDKRKGRFIDLEKQHFSSKQLAYITTQAAALLAWLDIMMSRIRQNNRLRNELRTLLEEQGIDPVTLRRDAKLIEHTRRLIGEVSTP